MARELELDSAAPLALTMTAELSDAFRSKREGVLFVMDAVREAFPRNPVFVLDCHGEFAALREARSRPLEFAATNWVAAALFAASRVDDCILVDVGSTTTDIVPIRGVVWPARAAPISPVSRPASSCTPACCAPTPTR